MRGKVARNLRRAAQSLTVGQPAIAYFDKTGTKVVYIEGKPTTVKTHQCCLTPKCTRAVYQMLKRGYKETRYGQQ